MMEACAAFTSMQATLLSPSPSPSPPSFARHLPRQAFRNGARRVIAKHEFTPTAMALTTGEDLLTLEGMAVLLPPQNFITILQKCREDKDLSYAKDVFQYACNSGLEKHSVMGNYLVQMFVDCGSLLDAWQLFRKLRHRNEHAWTSLMQGLVESEDYKQVLNLFETMRESLVRPSKYTFLALLKACSGLKCLESGQRIHSLIANDGFEGDPSVGNTLVDLYAKCGLLVEALEVFDKLPVHDVVSWNALIGGYVEHGVGDKALQCLERMHLTGLSPTPVTYTCSIKACSNIGATERGQKLHAEIVQKGLDKAPFVGNVLIRFYAKCGLLVEARAVFEELPEKDVHSRTSLIYGCARSGLLEDAYKVAGGVPACDVVPWNALMSGYIEHGLADEALSCLEEMQEKGIPLDAITYFCSLKACSSIGAIDKGQDLHSEIVKEGFEGDNFVGNTLVDLYAKCGCLVDAQDVFDQLPARDVVSWNALIAGYSCQGQTTLCFQLFEIAKKEGVQLNETSFLCILSLCSHAGLVGDGAQYYVAMSEEYGICGTLKHHNCMIDLYSRAGRFDKAMEVHDKMPCEPDHVTWNIVLAACKKWGNLELGKHAFQNAVKLDERDTTLVLMSNIYADAYMWKEAKEVE